MSFFLSDRARQNQRVVGSGEWLAKISERPVGVGFVVSRVWWLGGGGGCALLRLNPPHADSAFMQGRGEWLETTLFSFNIRRIIGLFGAMVVPGSWHGGNQTVRDF